MWWVQQLIVLRLAERIIRLRPRNYRLLPRLVAHVLQLSFWGTLASLMILLGLFIAGTAKESASVGMLVETTVWSLLCVVVSGLIFYLLHLCTDTRGTQCVTHVALEEPE